MRDDPFPLKKFTDAAVDAAYNAASAALSAAEDDEQRARIKVDADDKRDQALKRGPLLGAACTYLALAQAGRTVGSDDPERLYHFAANAFRDLGLLQRAAECYFNAALVGYHRYADARQGNAAFARRSAGRAKTMFADLGDDESSGDAHVLQQRIRLTELVRSKNYPVATLFWLWDRVSGFGTSPSRWLTSTLLAVVLFAIFYAMLNPTCASTSAPDASCTGLGVLTYAMAFSVGNLFQFGTLAPLSPASTLGQLVAVAHGVVAFVLIGSGATFLTRT